MQQEINIKNSIWLNAVPLLIMGVYMSFQVYNQSDIVFKILYGALMLGLYAMAVKEFQKKYFIQADSELVRIYFRFSQKSFLRTEIDHIRLNYAPFTTSYFKLKNGNKIKFNAWSMSDSDTEKFIRIHHDVRGGY